MQFIKKNKIKAEYPDGDIEVNLIYFGNVSENDQKTLIILY